MGIKFFGQYLVDKKIITRDDLRKAVQLQQKVNILFGATARAMGLMTDKDIERVHAAQRQKDLNFGDMCVHLGILNDYQMKQVAERQKKNHLHLGDALIRTNAIKAEVLPVLLDEFEADQAPYYVDTKPAPAGIPNEELWELFADRTYKMFTRVADLPSKPDQRSVVTGIEPNDTIVSMRMTGDVPCTYLLSVSANVRDRIAKAILQEDDIASEPREVLVDAVKEFTNIVCGSIAAGVQQKGKNIEFGAPEVLEVKAKYAPSTGAKGLLYPLHVAEGRVEVGVFWA